MNILITGVAGFIGFNLAKSLSKNHRVFGVDNYDNYYSIKLKRKRINELRKNKKGCHLPMTAFPKLAFTVKSPVFI